MNASKLINVLPQGTARQSSISQDSGSPEARALREDSSRDFHCHTETETDPWWRLDLGMMLPIHRIEIANCSDKRDAAIQLRVELSHDGEDWQLVYADLLPFGGGVDSPPLVLDLDSPIAARHLRLSMPGEHQALHLRDVKVLASQSDVMLYKLWSEMDWVRTAAGVIKPGYQIVDVGGDPTQDDGIIGIQVDSFGRFGNNVMQTLNAIFTAKRLGLQVVIAPQMQIDAPDGESRVKDLRLIAHEAPMPAGKYLRGPFYYQSDLGEPWYRTFDGKSRYNLVRAFLSDFFDLPKQTADPKRQRELAIHIRSGDLFGAKPHRGYAQPPLAYYHSVINSLLAADKIDRVCIVAEDRRNPCINAILENMVERSIPCYLQSGSLSDDIRYLLGASHVAYGYGTFGPAISLLAEHIESLHVFGSSQQELHAFGLSLKDMFSTMPNIALLRIYDFRPGSYISHDDWTASMKQRELMLHFPPEALELVYEHYVNAPSTA